MLHIAGRDDTAICHVNETDSAKDVTDSVSTVLVSPAGGSFTFMFNIDKASMNFGGNKSDGSLTGAACTSSGVDKSGILDPHDYFRLYSRHRVDRIKSGGLTDSPYRRFSLSCGRTFDGLTFTVVYVRTIFTTGPWTCRTYKTAAKSRTPDPIDDRLPTMDPAKSEIYLRRDGSAAIAVTCANPLYDRRAQTVAMSNYMNHWMIGIVGSEATTNVLKFMQYGELFGRYTHYRVSPFNVSGWRDDLIHDLPVRQCRERATTPEQRLNYGVFIDSFFKRVMHPLYLDNEVFDGHSVNESTTLPENWTRVLNTCDDIIEPIALRRIASATLSLASIEHLMSTNVEMHCVMFGLHTPYRLLKDMYTEMHCR